MITIDFLVWYSILQKHGKQNRMTAKWRFHVPYFIVFSTIFWYIWPSLWIVTWLHDCACTPISIWFYDMMDGNYSYFTVSKFNMVLITRFHCWLTFIWEKKTTGNLLCPIVAHVFCNMMGLPVFSSPRTKGVYFYTYMGPVFFR